MMSVSIIKFSTSIELTHVFPFSFGQVVVVSENGVDIAVRKESNYSGSSVKFTITKAIVTVSTIHKIEM